MDQEAGRRLFCSQNKLVPCCVDSTHVKFCKIKERVALLVVLIEERLAVFRPEDSKLTGGAAITQTYGRSRAKPYDLS